MVFGSFVNRGFLYGPICPIYGYGAVIMVLLAEFLKKKKINNLFLKFLSATILFSLLEYVGSLILELIFGLRWWDYSNEFLNLNGRICLMFSLLFGIMGLTFITLAYEPAEKLIGKIREKVSNKKIWIILIILVIIMVIDTIISTINYISWFGVE